jgi:hypothetical protein
MALLFSPNTNKSTVEEIAQPYLNELKHISILIDVKSLMTAMNAIMLFKCTLNYIKCEHIMMHQFHFWAMNPQTLEYQQRAIVFPDLDVQWQKGVCECVWMTIKDLYNL